MLKKLSVIQKLKGFEFTLNEIDEIIHLYEADVQTCQENLPKIHEKINSIDEKIRQLEVFRLKLLDCIKDCSPYVPCGCQLENTLVELK